jgi:phage terminase large subunit
MTYSKTKLHTRKKAAPSTLLGVFMAELDRELAEANLDGKWRWPNAHYRSDPVGFATDVLGIPVTEGMREILEAIRDNNRVVVAAGRKISKSLTDAVVALWWWSSWHDAKVIMTSTTARQVDGVLWEEVRKMHYRSQHGLDVECFDFEAADKAGIPLSRPVSTIALDSEPAFLARSGLQSGFRSLVGYTAREGVAAAGVSGARQLWIIDEASGVSQAIIDAIMGNIAGGGKMLLTCNPTSDEGEAYDAFHSKRKSEENPTGYVAIRLSSESSPNVVAGTTIIPGLAERDWIDERKREWGVDSAQYQIHVEGKHVSVETGKIVSLQSIKEAIERWYATGSGEVLADGVLHIGIDPALASDGDEAVFMARRGFRIVDIKAARGMNEHGHVAMLDRMLKEHRMPGEIAVVNVDTLGDVGSKVKVELTIFWRAHESEMVLVCHRGSDAPLRDPNGYVRHRDELWGSATEWLRDGGAIPENAKLERDLHTPLWVPGDLRQRKQATKKDVMKKVLGRSPDYGDALCLACWDGTRTARWAATLPAVSDDRSNALDPYAGFPR